MIIFGFTGWVCCFLWVLFQRRNRMLRRIFNEHEIRLKEKMEEHSIQMIVRDHHLTKYHFLKYNLSEALIAQNDVCL
jgi:16S rRNA A1518/A1519 N6-dimethyltransferase RsmA/KsgA/DIM1 with predicted DNA glycosylase/AP lyase activity